MTSQKIEELVRRTNELALEAVKDGNEPFGALLVDPDFNIILEAKNTCITEDPTGHAETNLCRKANRTLAEDVKRNSILITSTEPCIMCSSSIYWSGIKTIYFGCSGAALCRVIDENADLSKRLWSKQVLATATSVSFNVHGPYLEEEGKNIHKSYFRKDLKK
eukprot:TRINITY_DN948_c0_g1_i1.p1 TRINITY_DN948_c0_g1~~TRINITY_DN948_c0_g1_i1.p1  ORF type:complete len:163 (+),score=14.72 TRINITY_DN948_c0_g1_i1:60-548(+)